MKKFRMLSQTTPKTILTDDECSIAIAIKDEFPDSSHRLFVWFMCKNITKKLSCILGSDLTLLHKCFYEYYYEI